MPSNPIGLFFRVLKHAKLEALRRHSNCDLLDDKKLSTWETMLNLGVASSEFFEALERDWKDCDQYVMPYCPRMATSSKAFFRMKLANFHKFDGPDCDQWP